MNLKDCTEIGYVCRFFSSHWKLNGCKLRVICLIVSYVHFLPGVVQWGKPSTDICFEESVAIHLFHYPFSKTRAFQSYSSHGFQYITKPWFKLCYKPIYLRGEKKKTNGEIIGSGPPVEIMVRGVTVARNLGKKHHIFSHHSTLHHKKK